MPKIEVDNNGILTFETLYPSRQHPQTLEAIPLQPVTVARFWDDKNDVEMYYEGTATLNPNDNPCKAVGRRIALERCLEYADKETRHLVWNAVRREALTKKWAHKLLTATGLQLNRKK